MSERTEKGLSLLVFAGWMIVAISFAIGCVLILAEALFHQDNPYTSLVTYMLVPGVIAFGFSLVGLGVLLRWRRLKKHPDGQRSLPVIDLNRARTRRAVVIVGGLVTGFIAISGLGSYRAFMYTESTDFCGKVCHRVMEPEYEAHQQSAHARVRCVECHIGPGVGWYMRSKLSGMRQAYAIVAGDYELPIQTPLHNLRPARDTCEHCHWPAKFSGAVERIEWHFWFDEQNTPSRFHLLMRVGGVNPGSGRPEGIHWHSDSAEVVKYWARDRERLDIPWVAVEHRDGTRTVYRAPDLDDAEPPANEVRQMDCLDCHNRPAHIFRSPAELVNLALAGGTLDRKLPYLKQHAVEIMSIEYATRAEARERIAEEVARRYPVEGGLLKSEEQRELADTLIGFYESSHYPEHGVSWRTYPSHIGHRVFPGCFRCHSGQHRSDTGETISAKCDLCHDFVHQAYGDAANGPVTYRTQPFEHPGGQGDMHETGLCTECHSADVRYPGHPAEEALPVVVPEPVPDGAAPIPPIPN
jgi:hypothetical protein